MSAKIRNAIFMLLLLGLAFGAIPASAQETTATVTGRVTDNSGAVISGAEVTLLNVSTREERKTKSSDEGYYSLTFITPGIYDLSVKVQGFKESLNRSVELLVNDRKTINIQLEAGALSEQVTVTADAPIIQSSPTVGDVIENRRVVELPLNNRNFMQLVTLVPGVTSSGASEIGIGLTNVVNISIAGTRRNSINWLVDGVSNTDVGSSITLLSVPTIDSIQEFRIITSVPTAEFGRAAGGVVNLVTRGGTRNLHGGLYEFLRNDRMNANSFFRNAAGRFSCDPSRAVPDVQVTCDDPRVGTEVRPRQQLRYNNFGYNVGGPIWIPKLYERREKTFFFFSQEWRRIIRPTVVSITVPTLRQRGGDFSETGNLRIFDPLGTTQFPGNAIPTGRINSVSLAILKFIPEPNAPALISGREPNQFVTSSPSIQNTRQETMRGDHIFSSNHRLMVRYTHDLSFEKQQGGLFQGASFPIPNIATTDTTVPGQVLAVTVTSSFGPHIVSEISFNFSGNDITNTLVGQWKRPNVQIPIQELFPENRSDLPPTINTGIVSLGAGQLFDIHYKNYNPKANITWVRGSHTIKGGADLSWEQKNENSASATQGSFSYTGLQTRRGAGTGIAFADFLLGRASSYGEAESEVVNHLRFGRTEFYVQDTWKARPNIQLDYGLRYNLFRQPTDQNNILTAFLPELFNPAFAPPFANVTGTALQKGVGDPLDGIAIANVNSPFGRRVQKLDKNDIAPRFGFAWDPWNNGRTILRGGYGVYYDQTLVGIVEQNAFVNPPFTSSVTLTGTATSPIPYENPAAGTPPATLGIRNLITTTNPFVTPVVQQWNLTIQRELLRKASFEIGYLGSGGNHLIRPVDINAPTPQEILAASKGVAGCDPALNAANNPNTCINLARPFKGWGTITDRQTTATSRYHALISSFKMQPTHGFTTQVSYTWSKNITDATNDRDAVDLPQLRTNFAAERALSRLDRTHVFVVSYVYEVPTLKKGFLSNSVIRQVIGGWQISGGTVAQSGLPVPRIVQDTTPGPRGNRANQVGDPFGSVPQNVAAARNPFFFNPLAFRPTAVGDIGNTGRAIFRLPKQVLTTMQFAKNWRWSESYRVQFRVEMFNAFNHTVFDDGSFSLPTNRLPNDPIFNSLDSFLTTGSTFGQFISSVNPREIQLGLKFYF